MRIAVALLVTVLLLAVTGCGRDTSASTTTRQAARQISLAINGGQVRPAFHSETIKVGEMITLDVTSDTSDELHIHPAEIEKAINAGKHTSVTFALEAPGVYVAEAHHSGLELLELQVERATGG